MTHDRGKTIRRILQELSAEGYIVHHDVFNSVNYGLPQVRNRTLILHEVRNTEILSLQMSWCLNISIH